MQITFDFDIDDYAVFQYHYKMTARPFRISFYILSGIALILLVTVIANIVSPRVNSSIFPLLFWLILIVLCLWYIRSKKSAKRSVEALVKKEKGNSLVLGERTFLFENDYFMVTTTQSEHKLNWSVIRKVDEMPDYFFLYSSNYMAYVIPKQKIASQVQDLQELLHQHIPQEKYKLCKK